MKRVALLCGGVHLLCDGGLSSDSLVLLYERVENSHILLGGGGGAGLVPTQEEPIQVKDGTTELHGRSSDSHNFITKVPVFPSVGVLHFDFDRTFHSFTPDIYLSEPQVILAPQISLFTHRRTFTDGILHLIYIISYVFS